MATASQNQNRPRILRIAVIQGGKVIEDRLIKKREPVTIGQSSHNTFVIPVSNLPASFSVFELKGGSYLLRFTDAMDGQLAVGQNKLDFAALKAQGLAKRDRDAYAVPLTDLSKGKVALGEVTLLFQFATPPPEAPKPVLPDIAKGSLWQTMDRMFFGILAAVLVFNFGTVKAITLRELRQDDELTLEELPDRFVKMIIPDKPREPPKPKEVAQAAADKKNEDKKGDDKKPKGDAKSAKAAGPVSAEEHRKAIADQVASKGLLKMLGAVDAAGGGGSIEDVLSSGNAGQDIASALSGAGGIDAATTGGLASGARKGSATGAAAGIGALQTSGGAGGAGTLEAKRTVDVSGRVIDQMPEVESSSCDRNAISRYVKARIKAIQACYENALKRNPGLKGKVVVRFTIGPTGRVTELEIDENSLGNEAVIACIKTTIRLWSFPIKDNECPVAYPFLFQAN